MIDPHVHCRDEEESYKGETISNCLKHGFPIFDMPNTKKPVITRQRALERIKLADSENYFLYMGLTANEKQIEEAVSAHNELSPKVIGLKMYACHSVGDLDVISEEEQKLVYKTLGRLNYYGVLSVHCEKESLMRKELWSASNPKSHSSARPSGSEVASCTDQISFALSNNFKGHLHITHVSVPETAKLVYEAKGLMKISCGATPHHSLLGALMDYENLNPVKSLYLKVNPPIRGKKESDEILLMLKEGMIDFLESDHAPHSLDEKLNPPHLSGIPNLKFVRSYIKKFREKGFSEKRLEEITSSKIKDVFNVQINDKPLKEIFGNDLDTAPRDDSKSFLFNPYE